MGGNIQRQPLNKVIPKIYKRQWLEGVLFGWIRAHKTLVPSASVEQAIKSFYKDQDITEGEFPMQTCRTVYKRMTNEYYNSQKTGD